MNSVEDLVADILIPMDTEFNKTKNPDESTLFWSLDDGFITIKCKHRECRFKQKYRTETQDDEVFKLNYQEKSSYHYHSFDAHFSSDLKTMNQDKEEIKIKEDPDTESEPEPEAEDPEILKLGLDAKKFKITTKTNASSKLGQKKFASKRALGIIQE